MNFNPFKKVTSLALVLFSPSGQKVEIPPVSVNNVDCMTDPGGLPSKYDNYRFEGARYHSNKVCYTVGEYKEAQISDGGNYLL